MERFNYEINVRVLIAVRGAIFRLESLQRLDKTNHAHVGAIQYLARPLMQYGCDLLRLAWNQHKRRNLKGKPGTGGRPEELRRSRPHPGGQMQIPNGFDGVFEYEQASGRPLRRIPQTAALRDRCVLAVRRDRAYYAHARARRRARGAPARHSLSLFSGLTDRPKTPLVGSDEADPRPRRPPGVDGAATRQVSALCESVSGVLAVLVSCLRQRRVMG